MQLYGFMRSPRTWKVRAVAAHLGIPLDYKDLDPMQGEHKMPQYLALNPAGRTPTLVDGDFVLSESDAIMQYLASKTPNTLWPDDARTRADIMRWQNWQSAHWGSDACMPLTFQNLVKAVFGMGAPDAAVVAKATDAFNREASNARPALGESASGSSAPARRSPISRSARTSSTPTRRSCRSAPTRTSPAGSTGCRHCPAGLRRRRHRAPPLRPPEPSANNGVQNQKGRPTSRP